MSAPGYKHKPPSENRIEYWLTNAFTCNLLEVKPLTSKLKPSVLLAIVLTSDVFVMTGRSSFTVFMCVRLCVLGGYAHRFTGVPDTCLYTAPGFSVSSGIDPAQSA